VGSGSPWRGALLGLFYCIGLGIPFLLVALGFDWVAGSVAFIKRHIRAVNIIGGALLVVIGVLMVSGLWSELLSQFLAVIQGFEPAL
jgi:cytochrome c-type biogenesis protein